MLHILGAEASLNSDSVTLIIKTKNRRPPKNHPKCTDVHKKSSISVCCFIHLPSACRLFVYEYRLEFWWKAIDFGMVFIALTFGVLIFSYQKLYGYRLGFRWKIINFDQVFDAFTFAVSTRQRPAADHRDVDPLNPQARLWSSGSTTCESPWKDSRSRAWVRIPRAALFRDLIMRLRKSWKIEKNDQNQRKSIFYFSELRGRGKSSARIS